MQNDILVVGIPKSGTNALVKACKLVGLRPSEHMHTANFRLAEKHKVAYIYRNPRNVLISALRYRNHQSRYMTSDITEEKLIECFFDFFNAPINCFYMGYARWMTSQAHIVRFEDLIKDENELIRLADYGGVERKHGLHGELFGGTNTWTGELSDWRKFWTDGIDKVWKEEGMEDIEKGLGYGSDNV